MKHAFLDKYATRESPVHSLDARAKILVTFGLIVLCVSTPISAWPAFAGYAAFLVALAICSGVPLGFVAGRSLIALPFAGTIGLLQPFLHPDAAGWDLGPVHLSAEGTLLLARIVVTALIGAAATTLLVSTTRFNALLRGFEQLGVPRLLVTLGSFAYRFIFVLVDEVERMKRARDCRSFSGRRLLEARTIGRMIGTLFLRTYERAERVYQAMVCRGFEGRALRLGRTRFAAGDYLFTGCGLGLLAAMRFLRT